MGKIEVYPSYKEDSESKWSKNEVFSIKNNIEGISSYHGEENTY